ncbi:hypothetical protein LINPERPRIM_LOCUS21814 [Linum perenne]
MDIATFGGARARYARVCVEFYLTKPLLGKYITEDRVFHVENGSLGNIYLTCGFYDHKDEKCSVTNKPADPDQKDVLPKSKNISPEGDVRCWMTVCHRQKNRSAMMKNILNNQSASGSRFQVLTEEAVQETPKKSTNEPVKKASPNSPEAGSENANDHAEALMKFLDDFLSIVDKPIPSCNPKYKNEQKEPLKDITNSNSGTKLKYGEVKILGGRKANSATNGTAVELGLLNLKERRKWVGDRNRISKPHL